MCGNCPCQTSSVTPSPQSTRPVWVQQFLAQHDPDVDAIYRLTSSLPLDFNTSRTGLAIPEGTYIPYNAQATLHQREVNIHVCLMSV